MKREPRQPSGRVPRRDLLKGVSSLAVLVPVACGGDGEVEGPGAPGGTGGTGQGGTGGTSQAGGNGGTGAGQAGGAGGTGAGNPTMCALTPQSTEGPFYLDDDLLRSDITEGKPGILLTMNVVVVQMPDCTPMPNIPVDIWHSDHQGWYSGYPGQGNGTVDTTGQTFLRGTQISDAEGRVSFTTIYPGWYPGRAIHIHFKAHLPGNLEVTSQLYFPDNINDDVHTVQPYAAHGPVATSNAQDGIFSTTPSNDVLIADVVSVAMGYSAELVIGVL